MWQRLEPATPKWAVKHNVSGAGLFNKTKDIKKYIFVAWNNVNWKNVYKIFISAICKV